MSTGENYHFLKHIRKVIYILFVFGLIFLVKSIFNRVRTYDVNDVYNYKTIAAHYLHKNIEDVEAININRSSSRIDCILDKTKYWLQESGFSDMVRKKLKGNDAKVVSLVKAITDAPSDNMLKRSNNLILTPQAKQLLALTQNQKNGFFVECGALDGERSSNTIVLEVDYNWRGLLIEMDPFFYTQLLAKNRKSWSVNSCLSPKSYISYLKYSEDVSGRGQLLTDGLKGQSKITRTVPCFPLESFLLSLNRTKVDFFSLDVEGLELKVLETIPFKKFNITALSVEYNHVVGGIKKLESYMKSQGYTMYKKIDHEEAKITLYAHDLFFVKKTFLDQLKHSKR